MKSYEIFQTVFYKWIKSCAAVLACDILDENFKISLHTINTVIWVFSVMAFTLYTAYVYDFEMALKACTVFSLALQVSLSFIVERTQSKTVHFGQGIVKLSVILPQRRQIKMVVSSLERIYKQNEKSASYYVKTLEECSSNVFLVTKILSTLYIMCYIAFAGWPIFSYVLFGQVELGVPIILPMTDIDTRTGFMINVSYHIYILTLATVGFIFADAMYASLVFHVKMMSGLFAKHWDFINERLRTSSATSLEVKLLFRNLANMHQEMTT